MRKKNIHPKRTRNIIVGILSTVLVAELATAAVYIEVKADETSGLSSATETPEPDSRVYDLFRDCRTEDNTDVPTKNETVYVIADANGKTSNVIVSDWLSNPQHETALRDVSSLQDIENVNDDRTYQAENDSLTWDAQGADIYYQGTCTTELPITLTVTYYLDGKEILPTDLAGKSGQVKIRFDYENTAATTALIDGTYETVYVPFAALTGMILDNEHFHHIEISNGKIINDGNRTIVLGFALPGFSDSLKLDSDRITVPSYVEVTAETVDFRLLTTMTLATPSLMNEINLDNIQNLDDLQTKLAELDDAACKLLSGTATLFENLDLVSTKSKELVSGIDNAAEGAGLLAEAGGALSTGVTDARNGAIRIQSGVSQLTSRSSSLVDGAATVFHTLLSTADSQLTSAGLTLQGSLSIQNYRSTLNDTIAYYSSPEVFAGMLVQAYNNNIASAYGTPAATTYEEYITYVAAVSAQAGTDVDATLREGVTNTRDTRIIPALQGALNSLEQYDAFYQGIIAYTNGVDAVAGGLNTLIDGLNQLDSGAATLRTKLLELNTGLLAIQSGAHTLADGLAQLRDGSKELDEGMKQFYEEGISRLLTAVDIKDLNTMLARLQAIGRAGREYTSFAGIDENMPGTVKFLIETDSIR